MTLNNGTQLGPYEVISQIGAGGMGEVYRAHDTRLARNVAIKLLPASLANDKDRLRRFEQEARATSAINHPNILTVYDFGATEESGAPFIVSELLEGEELRDQLNKGPVSQRKVTDYALQVANGLAAAHSKGIIHRDLKPENLFVTSDGRVKILDFGLAKLRPIALPTEGTTQIDITNPGVVMGTVGYMSPEQVLGEPVDHRSDIFSFGVILYEMLSGERTFKGQSAFEVINAILKEDPQELSETNSRINPALEKIVRRCLEKDPARRFQSTTDLCFAIETLSAPSYSPIETIAAPSSVRRLFNNARLAWIVAAVIVAGLLGSLPLVNSSLRSTEPKARTIQSFIPEPENFGISSGVFSVSPDGHYLAFAGVVPGKQLLWVRPLDDLNWRSLAATEGATFPFWSPDNRALGFFADGKLKRIDVAGGPPLTLCDAPAGLGGTWNREGIIVFSPNNDGPLHRVSAAGGTSSPITKIEGQHASWDRWPSFLPDGRHFLFAHDNEVHVGSLDSQESKLLVRSASSPIYAQGYLLFLRERTLMVQRFDANSLELMGDAAPIAEPISTWGFRGAFSTSDDGILVHRTGQARGTYSQLVWSDRSGTQREVIVGPGLYPNLHLSPDEKKLAITTGGHARTLATYDLDRKVSTRFTLDENEVTEAAWSTDGRRLAFSSTRKGSSNLYVKPADGGGSEDLLIGSESEKYPTSWSPRGDYILYDVLTTSSSKSDLWVLPLGGDRKAFPFLQTEFNESRGQFSPDGRWVLYTSDESGRDEVYIASFPDGGGKVRISRDGGTYPRWRRDGKEIFYLAPDNKLMAVEIRLAGSSVKLGEPQALFEFRPANLYRNGYPYDVTSDGKRFVVNVATERKEQTFITLVQNWTANLKK